jgi:hypothetical protein
MVDPSLICAATSLVATKSCNFLIGPRTPLSSLAQNCLVQPIPDPAQPATHQAPSPRSIPLSRVHLLAWCVSVLHSALVALAQLCGVAALRAASPSPAQWFKFPKIIVFPCSVVLFVMCPASAGPGSKGSPRSCMLFSFSVINRNTNGVLRTGEVATQL